MKNLALISIVLAISACAPTKEKTVVRTVNVPTPGPVVVLDGPTTTVTVEVPAPAVEPTEVENMIADENDYRLSLGQLPLTRGLTCSLYNLLNGATPTPPQPQPANYPTSLPSASATFAYLGTFNQASSNGALGLQVLPQAIRGLYLQWYAIRCSGSIVLTDSGYHSFSTESDDASMLYIDNALVVNNNGNHGMQVRTGAKQLHSGVHTIRIDYMQGAGDMGLIVNMDGAVLPAELLWR